MQGHVIDKLRELPDESVHTIITSPPYWGLRRYGTQPQIWKGDDPLCAGRHEWVSEKWKPPSQIRNRSIERFNDKTKPKGITELEAAFCLKCGAWRGELGLEPTPELYIRHLVEIFREARRVLRPDGTLWLNLGDSYWGGKGASGANAPEYSLKRKGETLTRVVSCIGERGWTKPGDGKHSTIKPKDLVGIPWMAALALRDDGWFLRSDIIWEKPSCLPESVRDRVTRSHEYLFLLTKQRRYFFDHIAFREPTKSGKSDKQRMRDGRPRAGGKYVLGDRRVKEACNAASLRKSASVGNPEWRNRRSVWSVAPSQFRGKHFATFPVKLVEPCVLAGTSEQGCCSECGAPLARLLPKSSMRPHKFVPTCRCKSKEIVPCRVLDLFNGAATTAIAAMRNGRDYLGIELKREYVAISEARIREELNGKQKAAASG